MSKIEAHMCFYREDRLPL